MKINIHDIVANYVLEGVDGKKRLLDAAVHVIQSINVHPSICSYVIPVSFFLPFQAGYFNVVYYKNPVRAQLFVSSVSYDDIEKSKRMAQKLFDKSGKYIFEKRFDIGTSKVFHKQVN